MKKPRKEGYYYCPKCDKYYPKEQCKEEFEFSMDGGFLESAWLKFIMCFS